MTCPNTRRSLLIAFGLALLVLAVGSVLWAFESGLKGGDIHGYGAAVFFTAVLPCSC